MATHRALTPAFVAVIAVMHFVVPHAAGPAPRVAPANSCPVRVGERAHYTVKYGPVPVGRATITAGADSLRGKAVWHIAIRVTGGVPFYRVDNRIESWVDPDSLYAMRFVEHLHQGSESFVQEFDFYPERRVMVGADGKELPTVDAPIDDASLIFLMRHQVLDTGSTWKSRHYFWPEANPISVRIDRREAIDVPAGTFTAIVIRPSIATSTVFMPSSRAEVHLADDASRIVLRLRAHMAFGSLAFNLKSVEYDSVSPTQARLACGQSLRTLAALE